MVRRIQTGTHSNADVDTAKKSTLAQHRRAKERNQGVVAEVSAIANNLFTTIKSNPRTCLIGLLALGGGYASYSRNTKSTQPSISPPKAIVRQANLPHEKANLPPTFDSNPHKKWDYRSGQGAKSYQEFKNLISREYEVRSNKIAKDERAFIYNPIIVYGEAHDNPRLPNLPTEKGFVLMESRDLQKCLPKYYSNPSNKCVIIDESVFLDQLSRKYGEVSKAQEKVSDLVRPEYYKKIMQKVARTSNEMFDLTSQVDEFLQQNFGRVLEQADEHTQKDLHLAAQSYLKIKKEFELLEANSRNNRDNVMTLKSIEVVKQAGEDSSAIVLVGASHAEPIAKGLMKEFPERPVVLAIDHKAKAMMRESKPS